MTRTSLQRSIEFRGLIEGCADHQWLLTDALYHSGATPPSQDNSPRWVICSDLVDASSSHSPDDLRNHFVAHDRQAGWTLSASSAAELADQIQRHYSCAGPSSPAAS